jgi:hypothetical protein
MIFNFIYNYLIVKKHDTNEVRQFFFSFMISITALKERFYFDK